MVARSIYRGRSNCDDLLQWPLPQIGHFQVLYLTNNLGSPHIVSILKMKGNKTLVYVCVLVNCTVSIVTLKHYVLLLPLYM